MDAHLLKAKAPHPVRTQYNQDGIPLASSFQTPGDKEVISMALTLSRPDWKIDGSGQPIVKSIPAQWKSRAVYQQCSGIPIPISLRCSGCVRGNGPFESCRVAFGPNGHIQSSGACMNCALNGAATSCQLRTFTKTERSKVIATDAQLEWMVGVAPGSQGHVDEHAPTGLALSRSARIPGAF